MDEPRSYTRSGGRPGMNLKYLTQKKKKLKTFFFEFYHTITTPIHRISERRQKSVRGKRTRDSRKRRWTRASQCCAAAIVSQATRIGTSFTDHCKWRWWWRRISRRRRWWRPCFTLTSSDAHIAYTIRKHSWSRTCGASCFCPRCQIGGHSTS